MFQNYIAWYGFYFDLMTISYKKSLKSNNSKAIHFCAWAEEWR